MLLLGIKKILLNEPFKNTNLTVTKEKIELTLNYQIQ